jgi:hypothetical protein
MSRTHGVQHVLSLYTDKLARRCRPDVRRRTGGVHVIASANFVIWPSKPSSVAIFWYIVSGWAGGIAPTRRRATR